MSSFLPFRLHVKKLILFFVYLDDYNPTVVNPSLRREDIPSFIIDLNLIPSFEPTSHVHISIPPKVDPSCKSVNNKDDLLPPQVITAPFCGQVTYVQSNIKEGYKPLKPPFVLHDYPPNFLDYLLRFNGEDHVTIEKHMVSFERFTDLLQIIHEDFLMRTFYQSLYGEPRIWLRSLKVDSIESWTDFHAAFLKYWGENKYFDQYLIELNALKRK
jgi:hypothetical protein